MTACVVLPWPPAAMSPNGAHGHWAGKSSAARAYKRDCWALCKAAGLAPMEAEAVEIAPEIEALAAVEPVERIWARNLLLHRRRVLAGVLA